MASLETLTIEINANATQASTGIDQLATSFSNLSKRLGSSISGLKIINQELQNLQRNSNVRLPNLSRALATNQTARAARATTQAIQQQTSATNNATEAVRRYNIQTENLQFATTQANSRTPYSMRETGLITGGMFGRNVRPNTEMTVGEFSRLMEQGRAYIPGMSNELASSYVRNIMDQFGENANWQESAHSAFSNIPTNLATTTEAMRDYRNEVEQTTNATRNATTETRNLVETTREVGRATATVRQAHRATNGLLSQVGRIARTMLIRTAIRAVMRLASQGVSNFYNYSREVSNIYAETIDNLRAGATAGGNQIGAALGTLLNTIAPILNAIIGLVTMAAEALTMLFSLLGGGTTYIRATNGLNSVAKAAGGAGGKIKELLASFDELNVISQESGGGGGGSSGGFGSAFEEVPLPQWLIEWGPLLEALIAGTLGAILLPKLWDFLKRLFGFGLDGLSGKNINFNVTGLEEAMSEAGALTAELNAAKAAANGIRIPSMATALAEAGGITAALTGATAAAEALGTALSQLFTGLSIIELLKTLLELLASKLLGGTKIKIDVDRKAFDEFKDEYEEWKKSDDGKNIKIVPDVSELQQIVHEMKHWTENTDIKNVRIDLDATEFRKFVHELRHWLEATDKKHVQIIIDNVGQFWSSTKEIDQWTKRKDVKKLSVSMDVILFTIEKTLIDAWVGLKATKHITVSLSATDYTMKKLLIDAWTSSKDTKHITVAVSTTDYNRKKTSIDDWVSRIDTKIIKIDIVTAYLGYLVYKTFIDNWVFASPTKRIWINIVDAYLNFMVYAVLVNSWVNATPTKTIRINIWDAYSTYLDYANAVMNWVNKTPTKYIAINIYDAYDSFLVYASLLTTWAITSVTKYIYINIYNWDSFWDKASLLKSWANETITKYVNIVITGSVNLSKPTGLDWSLMNGLTWNGQNVLDLAINSLGFAEGGFPTSGDLFIANEQGAEMIGSLNGRTAVANTDQIVAGIAQGVSEANSEQNALLRQQNEYLRGILEKDASVRIGASAALGRVAKQSLDMYGSLVGG